MAYIKCEKCSAEVTSQEVFKEKLNSGEWFIGKDKVEQYYDYKHNCLKH